MRPKLSYERLKRFGSRALPASLLFGSAALGLALLVLATASAKQNERSTAPLSSTPELSHPTVHSLYLGSQTYERVEPVSFMSTRFRSTAIVPA